MDELTRLLIKQKVDEIVLFIESTPLTGLDRLRITGALVQNVWPAEQETVPR